MSQTDNSLPRWNTTCTIWHGPVMEGPALLNGATAPDLIGIPCRLEPAMAAQPTVTGGFVGITHRLSVPAGVDLRDGWPAGPWPVVAIPDTSGARFEVILVVAARLGTPWQHRQAWLRRLSVPWPVEIL